MAANDINSVSVKDAARPEVDLYNACRGMISAHSAGVMNAVRDAAFADFCRLGFPSRSVERYKYTDIAALFAPDYGLNLNRLDIPVDMTYSGTNHTGNVGQYLYVTTTRPAWMNWQISQMEERTTTGVMGRNNPNPSGLYAIKH